MLRGSAVFAFRGHSAQRSGIRQPGKEGVGVDVSGPQLVLFLPGLFAPAVEFFGQQSAGSNPGKALLVFSAIGLKDVVVLPFLCPGGDGSDAAAGPSVLVREGIKEKFSAYTGKIRKPGTGGIYELNDHLYEGRYSPTNAQGKREVHTVYAKTKEECETLLEQMIAEVKAKIAAEKELLKAEQNPPEA